MDKIEYGFCYCGCGQKVSIAKLTNKRLGHIKGEPVNFIKGHMLKHGAGKDNPNWKGGKHIRKGRLTNYVMIHMPEHLRSNHLGYISEHIMVVEKALGFPIGNEAVVHHIDFNGLNNDLNNLMVFKNCSEHVRFHAMLRKKIIQHRRA